MMAPIQIGMLCLTLCKTRCDSECVMAELRCFSDMRVPGGYAMTQCLPEISLNVFSALQTKTFAVVKQEAGGL